jgi:hypothetical protein
VTGRLTLAGWLVTILAAVAVFTLVLWLGLR